MSFDNTHAVLEMALVFWWYVRYQRYALYTTVQGLRMVAGTSDREIFNIHTLACFGGVLLRIRVSDDTRYA